MGKIIVADSHVPWTLFHLNMSVCSRFHIAFMKLAVLLCVATFVMVMRVRQCEWPDLCVDCVSTVGDVHVGVVVLLRFGVLLTSAYF